MPLTVDLLNIGFIFVNVFATSCFISISVNKPLFLPQLINFSFACYCEALKRIRKAGFRMSKKLAYLLLIR